MPLLDHFHSPVFEIFPWESLHSAWATQLVNVLMERWLPPRFLALEHGYAGPRVEIDVATYERTAPPAGTLDNGGGVATLPQTWAPPTAACAVPILFPDSFEVRVYSERAGWFLVGAVEFISPGNKDRAEERRAFAAKCASYLHRGVSVALIDVVTNRGGNLHNEVLRMIGVADARAFLPEDVSLYAAAYRPVLRQDRPELDVWRQECALGQPLPDMPLRLTGDLFVPIEFEATYMDLRRMRKVL